MAELADAADSKSADFTIVRVRPPLQVPKKSNTNRVRFFCFIITNPFIYQGLQILHCLTQVRDKSIIKSLKKSIFGRKSANFQWKVLDTYQQLTQFRIISNLPVV